MEPITCALRALNLCDGHQVVDFRCAHGHVPCYSARIDALELEGRPEAASELRSDRARTVARSERLQRRTARSEWLETITSRPPF